MYHRSVNNGSYFSTQSFVTCMQMKIVSLSFVLGEFFFSEDKPCYACSFVQFLMKYGGMDFNEHC